MAVDEQARVAWVCCSTQRLLIAGHSDNHAFYLTDARHQQIGSHQRSQDLRNGDTAVRVLVVF